MESQKQKPIAFELIKDYPGAPGPVGMVSPYTTGYYLQFPEHWKPIYKKIPDADKTIISINCLSNDKNFLNAITEIFDKDRSALQFYIDLDRQPPELLKVKVMDLLAGYAAENGMTPHDLDVKEFVSDLTEKLKQKFPGIKVVPVIK